MKKSFLGSALVALLLAFLMQTGVYAAPAAVLSPQVLRVDGMAAACEMYNIDGSNYVKLRDIAYLLSGTGSQFSVNADGETAQISVVTGEAYTPDGSELSAPGTGGAAAAAVSRTVSIDGNAVTDLQVYEIGGSDFYRLRALGAALGFAVDYDADANAAIVGSISVKTVSTAEQLLNAVASNTKIILSPGTYDLSSVKFTSVDNPNISWETLYDGTETIITGVKNCAFIGSGAASTAVVVEPRYADVLEFHNCSGITVRDLTAGHTIEPGYCVGGVINLQDSSNITVASCDLYGCGTYGITTEGVNGLTVRDTVIRDCSYGIMTLSSSSLLSFENSRFHDCGGFTMLSLDNCKEVSFKSCEITGNVADYSQETLIYLALCKDVTFDGCSFSDNRTDSLLSVFNCTGIAFSGNSFSGNTFTSGTFAEYSDTDVAFQPELQ